MDDTLYLFVNKHIYTVDCYWCVVVLFIQPSVVMALDAATWNCAGGELSSCVINNIPLHHVL